MIVGGLEYPMKGPAGTFRCRCLGSCNYGQYFRGLSPGDIGKHFPDTDPEYRIYQHHPLGEVFKLMKEQGYEIGNIDATVAAQRPKLALYIDEMRANIAKVLETELENINIKATTTEELGFVGRKEGISSYCVCLLKKFSPGQ